MFCEFYITNDGIMLFCLLCRTCGDFGTRRTTFWWSAVHYLLIVCKLVCNLHHFYSIVQYHTSVLCMHSDPMSLLKQEMILLWKCLSHSAIHIPNLHPLDAAFFFAMLSIVFAYTKLQIHYLNTLKFDICMSELPKFKF